MTKVGKTRSAVRALVVLATSLTLSLAAVASADRALELNVVKMLCFALK
jgi:hypothetical protein